MWNSCCRGPAPGVLLSGLVKSLPEFPAVLKVRKSQNWISCHLFSFNAWAGAFGQSSCMVWPWYLRAPWMAPSQGTGVWWFSLSESLSVQGNSLLVWKVGKGQALMSPLPSIACRSTGTASNPNSYYCLCKLRVRSPLSREIAGKAGAAGRGWAEESLVCTGVWGESCWDRELTLSEVTPDSSHSQWLQGKMAKPPWKNPNFRSEAKAAAAADYYYYLLSIIQCFLWLYIEVSLQIIKCMQRHQVLPTIISMLVTAALKGREGHNGGYLRFNFSKQHPCSIRAVVCLGLGEERQKEEESNKSNKRIQKSVWVNTEL